MYEPTAWYFHLQRPENGPRPMYDTLTEVWYKAERADWLIIFEATTDEINKADKESKWQTTNEEAVEVETHPAG